MANTYHTFACSDSRSLPWIPEESVDLIVTSPPYPMIEMWDELFSSLDPRIGELLPHGKAPIGRSTAAWAGAEPTTASYEMAREAHERMHQLLDSVWREGFRVLRPGGILCINVGDATRTIDGHFSLYSNHTRIASYCLSLGFTGLPVVLWRKQTNAPTKFMGSGMFPPGAYITLEHEYILVFRKGEKREFRSELERENRRESAYFWEERNTWFSDIWDFKGSKQKMGDELTRGRSGAFPFELAFRLLCMFSVRSDLVLDPFVGTGTTLLAAAATGRSSIGVELDRRLVETAASHIVDAVDLLRAHQENRIERHLQFVERRRSEGKMPAHLNRPYGFPVVTRQEIELKIDLPVAATSGPVKAEEVPAVSPSSHGEYPQGSIGVTMQYRPYAHDFLPFH